MKKSEKLTTAQALIKFLNSQYIEFDGVESKFIEGIFTIFGHGNVLGLGQALEENPGTLVVHQGRNEQGMAHAAIAFAKQMKRRKIYACTSSVGPGAANFVTAAATASANRIPILLLPGDTFASRQPDPVLQQIEQPYDLSITTNDALRPVSKYWDRVNRPEQLMSAMINAMRVLTDPENCGAVTICLPQDVGAQAYDYPEYFFKKRVHRIERMLPTKNMIKDAVSLLIRKKRPLIICGGGVKYSEAQDVLREFTETFNIPFAETQAGKSAIPYDHYLNLGGVGTTGGLAANLIAKEADLVIGVGTRYTDFTTGSKSIYSNNEVEFLNINIGSLDSIKLDGVPVKSDAKVALLEIAKELKKIKYKNSYRNQIKNAKERWDKELKRLFNVKYDGKTNFQPEIDGHLNHVLPEFSKQTGSFLTQTRVLGIINDVLGENDIVISASGSLPGDMQRVWRAKGHNTYHMEYGYSCMGYEINGALGVKLAAERNQDVYAFVGDGSYMMLHSELPTSVQEGEKINVLLFDNMSFGCINNLQMGTGMGSFGTEFRFRDSKSKKLDGTLVPINFAMNAASYGCKTYSVKNEKELRNALADAKKQKVSTLIDIKVLPKTMTHGYESWWRAGIAEVSKKKTISAARKSMDEGIVKAREY